MFFNWRVLHISMATKKDQNPKYRIKLRSYDVRMLEASLSKVLGVLVKSGAGVK